MRFETALAHVPLTLPSHATMLTGLLPPASGVRDNGAGPLDHAHPVVAEMLASSGYRTAAVVSGFPLDRRFGLARGFQTYEDRMPRGRPGRAPFVERQADRTIDLALKTIETLGEPFFLWVHLFDPHAPYEPPAEHEDAYDGEIAFADSQIARLRSEPKLSSAVWIVTSDHGESLGEHGEETHGLFVYDSTMRVPLIVAGRGIRARVVREPAMLVDIAPTIVRLAGCETEAAGSFAGFAGSYLLDKLSASRAVYGESLFGQLNCGWAPLFSLRRDRWKYIEAPRAELYDVRTDPAELRSLLEGEQQTAASLRVDLRSMRGSSSVERADLDSETAKRLASLGYISGGNRAAGSGEDPKDMIDQANRLERALAAVHVRPAEAESELRKICDDEPENVLARRHWAASLAGMQRYREAVEVLRQLSQSGADILSEQAEYLRLDGRPQEGIEAAERAIELDERSPEAHLAMAKCLAALGKSGEAMAALSQAIAIRPDSVEAYQISADISAARGDFRAAADAMRRVYERDAADTSLAMKYGILLVRAGEPAAAASVFRGVTEREPSNASAALSLAGALAKAGDPAGAIQWFERAIASGMRTSACFNGLAMARLEVGDRSGARTAIGESLKIDPNQPQLRALVEQIER